MSSKGYKWVICIGRLGWWPKIRNEFNDGGRRHEQTHKRMVEYSHIPRHLPWYEIPNDYSWAKVVTSNWKNPLRLARDGLSPTSRENDCQNVVEILVLQLIAHQRLRGKATGTQIDIMNIPVSIFRIWNFGGAFEARYGDISSAFAPCSFTWLIASSGQCVSSQAMDLW